MTVLHLDFESRSEIDLRIRGLDNYVKHGSTKCLMMAWAFDEDEVQLWEAHKSEFPKEVREVLLDSSVVKTAWNASFERSILKFIFRTEVPYDQFYDVMINARMLSLPGYLEDAGDILQIDTDYAKVKMGEQYGIATPKEAERLKNLFCQPAQFGGEETLFGVSETFFRNWETDPRDWELFCEYCKQDVRAERAIMKKLAMFPLPEIEKRGWVLDQTINERGLPVDLALVRGSKNVAEIIKTDLRAQLKELTQLDNSNSNPQMLAWLRDKGGYTFNSLGKGFVARALAGECFLTDAGEIALEIRKQSSKTSDSKLDTLLENVSDDGRLRHQFLYMGAAKTGRFSGQGFQFTNLPRPSKVVSSNLESAVNILRDGDYLSLALEFPFPMEAVTGIIRSVFRTPDGKKFLVADLNAVEYRVLAWLTGCDPMMEVLRKKLCPYKSFGVDLFNKPYEEITKDERQNSKPAVLGCGYQLSGGERTINKDGDVVFTGLMGYARSLGVELSQNLAEDSVKLFRQKYGEVVDFWGDIEDHALDAVRSKKARTLRHIAVQQFSDKLMQIMLPSGRGIYYIRPRIEEDEKFKKPGITYEGKIQGKGVWGRLKTYGGRLTENVTQAVARDVLLNGMFEAEKKGLPVVGHCHDELLCEIDANSKFVIDDLCECMSRTPEWAEGLILGAEGYEDRTYHKE